MEFKTEVHQPLEIPFSSTQPVKHPHAVGGLSVVLTHEGGGAHARARILERWKRLDGAGGPPPARALARLNGILDWYREVQAGGGYQKYYETHDGTLQGGGPPGGLGLDQEFFESMMAPSVIICGFLGSDARPDGLHANPRLPEAWPTLTATNISYWGWLFDLTANPSAKNLRATVRQGDAAKLNITVPSGWTFETVGMEK